MGAAPARFVSMREISISCGGSRFEVELALPENPLGLVLLVRGNGNVVRGRPFSVLLHEAGLASATCQVLTWVEREHPIARYGIVDNATVLTDRLVSLLDGIRGEPDMAGLPVGLLGSGTVAAAALEVAARRPLVVDALVCRNGRLDLAAGIPYVQAPTLLLVSSAGGEILRQNDSAFARLNCSKRFEVLHEKDEARSLTRASDLAREWFVEQLGAVPA